MVISLICHICTRCCATQSGVEGKLCCLCVCVCVVIFQLNTQVQSKAGSRGEVELGLAAVGSVGCAASSRGAEALGAQAPCPLFLLIAQEIYN